MSNTSASHRPRHHRLLLLFTLLVVYVLSSAPVHALYSSHRITGAMPKGLVTCYQPVAWLHDHSPLGKSLAIYSAWWARILKRS